LASLREIQRSHWGIWRYQGVRRALKAAFAVIESSLAKHLSLEPSAPNFSAGAIQLGP